MLYVFKNVTAETTTARKLKIQAINPSLFMLLCAGLQGRELEV